MNLFSMIGDLYGEAQRKSLLIAVDIETDEPLALLYVDAVLSESVNYSKTITDFPVEKGPSPSDHAHIEPIKVTLHCVMSEDPLEESGIWKDSLKKVRQMTGINSELSDQMFAAGVDLPAGLPTSLISNNKYILNAVDFIEQAMKETSYLIIKIGLGYYFDLALESVGKVKDAGNTGVLEFDLNLKELNFVRSKFIDMDDYVEFNPDIPDLGKYGDGMSPTADTSVEEEEDLTPEERAERSRTRLIRLLEWIVKNIADIRWGF